MPPTPRKSIDPEFIAGLDCPICGQDALNIKSLANYPDFVACGNCDSQFAVEQEGDRIMYGKMPATYPRTKRFALQQWAWPEAIARRAAAERPDSQSGITSPTTEAPPPVSAPIEAPAEAGAAEPDLPEPDDLEPQEPAEEPAPMESAGSSFEPTLSDELPPAAEPADSFTPATEVEPEEAPLEEATTDFDSLTTAEEADSTSSIEDSWPAAAETPETDPTETDEDFLTELPEEFDQEITDFGLEAEDAAEDMLAASQLTEEEPEQAETPAIADRLPQAAEETTPVTPESTDQDEAVLEDLPQEVEAEPTFPADWASGPEAAEGFPDADEEDFFSQMEQAESEADLSTLDQSDEPSLPDDWDEAEADFEGIFTPPFGDDEPEETDDMQEDFEPAPEMPNWLNQADPMGQAEAQDEDELDAIDFTGLHDEADDEPVDSSFGQEEDLLASLWGDETDDGFDSPAKDEEDLDLDDELAGFAGLGAIDDAAEDIEELFNDEATDLWDQEPAAETSTTTPETLDPDSEPAMTEEKQRDQIARSQWAGDQTESSPELEPLPEIGEDLEEGEAISLEAEEPPPGERYRVVLQKHEATFPQEICAHCSQSPTVAKVSIAASVYRGAGVGERQTVSYRVPVCADCRDRAKARSDERQTAQLQAHLISVLVALILVVSALAFRLVDFQERVGVDLAVLLLLAVMGYAIPAAFLLIRASRIGKPADAEYVETTLRVPGDTEGAETAFEFRSKRYAHHFHQNNEDDAVSGVNKVRERQYEKELT